MGKRPHWSWPVAAVIVAWLLLYPAAADQLGNAIVNLRQLNGTAIDTNSGTKSAGTQRVVLATDQPQPTNKFLVTPDANSAVNISQMNGTTVTMGNGAAGTGVQRVVVASDNSAVAGMGVGATAAAIPANADYVGGTDGTNLVGFYIDPCQRGARTRAMITQTSGTTIITGTSAKNTFICDIDIVTATAQNIALVSGTGTVCASGIHAMAGGTTAATGWNFAANGGLVKGMGGFFVYQTTTTADNVCLLQSGSGQISGSMNYVQY